MLKILIVEDLEDKIKDISTAISLVAQKFNFEIECVSDYISAIDYLQLGEYDLLILDLNFPRKVGEKITPDLGFKLNNDIDINKNLHAPRYITYLTQYSFQLEKMNLIWPIISYDKSNKDWSNKLQTIIKHIIKAKSFINQNLLPNVFVEGYSDKIILEAAIHVFYPDLLTKLRIRTAKSAGVNWITNQIISWAHALNKMKDKPDEYLISLGLYDHDDASKKALEKLRTRMEKEIAPNKTFRILKHSLDYAIELREFKKNGYLLPISIEEMVDYSAWEYASQQGWLLKEMKKITSKSNEQVIDQSLIKLDKVDKLQLYLYKFNDDHKQDFAKYIASLPDENKIVLLKNFKKLIEDICIKIKIELQLVK